MSGNRYITAMLCWVLAIGCIPRPALMDPAMPPEQLPKGFFGKLPPLLQLDHIKADFSMEPLTDKNMIVASFTEKYIEKDNLLSLSELSDKSNYPPVTYDDMEGFSQQLFLYHIQTRPDKIDAIVFVAARYNDDGVCIGTGPYYLGTLNLAESHIDFMYTLTLRINKGDTSLVPEKPISKLKKMSFEERYPSRIVFLYDCLQPVEGKPSWEQLMTGGIAVNKIIDYHFNKIGGKQPVVYDIGKIMRDQKAIQFITPQPFDE